MRLTRSLRSTRGHGFFTEIVIIVIGVLIALAAGQGVEALNWQRKVAEGEQQLLQEARTNIRYGAEQVAVQPCLEAQLRALRARVLASEGTLAPAPAYDEGWGDFVFRMPSRPFGTAPGARSTTTAPPGTCRTTGARSCRRCTPPSTS